MFYSRLSQQLSFSLLLAVVVLLSGACAGSNGIADPITLPTRIENQGSHHYLWGYWNCFIPESLDTIEFVPARSSQFHFNARRFAEYLPCNDCLQLESVTVNTGLGTLSAEIQITHPFPGLDRYTGFNVRAIVISNGSRYFPGLDATVPDAGLGDFTLENPEGFTRLWNTVEFPEGSGLFPILEYSEGNLASPGGFTGTVNPFISFFQMPRNHFPAGQSITKVFKFKYPLLDDAKFGYAIDVSWEPPIADPPVNIQDDFPVSANAAEALGLCWVGNDALTDVLGDQGSSYFEVLDYQGWETIAAAEIECPGLWTGVVSTYWLEYMWTIPDGDIVRLHFNYTNEFGAPSGQYKVLVRIKDNVQNPWLGDINHAYILHYLEVEESLIPQFTGKAVFLAPGPEDPWGHSAQNVFEYDFETGIETLLTSFMGLGYLFHEPRINPAATHHLHCAGPTPYYRNVVMYEFGGSSWTITTDEVDDYADFHPDGLHVITASGTVWGDTPNLYTMTYDGSDRTLLATATESISNPMWCPDANRIAMTLGPDAYDGNSELYIYNVTDDEFTEIMAADGFDQHPSWSGVQVDGAYLLAFDSTRDHFPNTTISDVYIVNPETGEVLLHLSSETSMEHPAFSPDGKSILFSASIGENDTELYVYEWYTDGDTVKITDDETYDTSPHWSWNW